MCKMNLSLFSLFKCGYVRPAWCKVFSNVISIRTSGFGAWDLRWWPRYRHLGRRLQPQTMIGSFGTQLSQIGRGARAQQPGQRAPIRFTSERSLWKSAPAINSWPQRPLKFHCCYKILIRDDLGWKFPDFSAIAVSCV